ncbi:MAG: DUF4386 domain-containing protein [Chitinophagaceae bacterium]
MRPDFKMSLPKNIVRLAGIFYLIEIVAGIFTEAFVRGKIVVAGNAAATANNILTSTNLWRIGFASDLTMLLCDVFVTLILYALLKHLNKNIALIAAAFSLITDAIQALSALFHFTPLFILGDNHLTSFAPNQQQDLTMLFLHLRDYGNMIGLVFFSFHCVLLGYLIYKSPLPKILGVFFVAAGLCYFINSFSWFLYPSFAANLFPFILLPCLVAELSLSLWFMFKGNKVQNELVKMSE